MNHLYSAGVFVNCSRHILLTVDSVSITAVSLACRPAMFWRRDLVVSEKRQYQVRYFQASFIVTGYAAEQKKGELIPGHDG